MNKILERRTIPFKSNHLKIEEKSTKTLKGSIFYTKLLRTLLVLINLVLQLMPHIFAAQNDRIITIITKLTQDLYGDFVYLSLGFLTTICVFHLIMIVFKSNDDQSRNQHVKAIFTAVIAWVIINILTFFIAKVFNLTGQNTPADIFNTGNYN